MYEPVLKQERSWLHPSFRSVFGSQRMERLSAGSGTLVEGQLRGVGRRFEGADNAGIVCCVVFRFDIFGGVLDAGCGFQVCGLCAWFWGWAATVWAAFPIFIFTIVFMLILISILNLLLPLYRLLSPLPQIQLCDSAHNLFTLKRRKHTRLLGESYLPLKPHNV